jgi:hypothetical protein
MDDPELISEAVYYNEFCLFISEFIWVFDTGLAVFGPILESLASLNAT